MNTTNPKADFDNRARSGDLFSEIEIMEQFDLIRRFNNIGSSIYGKEKGQYDSDCDEFNDVIRRAGEQYDDSGAETFYVVDNYCIQRINADEYLVTKYDTEIDNDTIAARYVAEYYNDSCDIANSLETFGIEYKLFDFIIQAKKDFRGDCKIIIRPNYFASHMGAPMSGYVRDDTNNIIIFNDYSTAESWVKEIEKGIYILNDGETARPDYIIVKD